MLPSLYPRANYFRAETPQLTSGTQSNSTKMDQHGVELNKGSGALCLCHQQPRGLGRGQPEQDLVYSTVCLVRKLRLITSLRNYSLYAIRVLALHTSPKLVSTLACSSLYSNYTVTCTCHYLGASSLVSFFFTQVTPTDHLAHS